MRADLAGPIDRDPQRRLSLSAIKMGLSLSPCSARSQCLRGQMDPQKMVGLWKINTNDWKKYTKYIMKEFHKMGI